MFEVGVGGSYSIGEGQRIADGGEPRDPHLRRSCVHLCAYVLFYYLFVYVIVLYVCLLCVLLRWGAFGDACVRGRKMALKIRLLILRLEAQLRDFPHKSRNELV